eukprot:9512352-Lingulodinium_polyedra.AAC.1
MMPDLFAPESRANPSQSKGGTRKSSLMNSRAFEHAMDSNGRKDRNAQAKGHPALFANCEVISCTNGRSCRTRASGKGIMFATM